MPLRVVWGIEELKTFVGQEIGVSDWLEISQHRISQFAEAIEDRQWIHVDPERAKTESPYGGAIAHGFLTLSLLSHLMAGAIRIEPRARMGINYGLNRVRFPAPVPAGARVRGRFRLQSVEEFDGGAQFTWGATVESEGARKPCLVAEWITRYYR